jgi:hypothetical protein
MTSIEIQHRDWRTCHAAITYPWTVMVDGEIVSEHSHAGGAGSSARYAAESRGMTWDDVTFTDEPATLAERQAWYDDTYARYATGTEAQRKAAILELTGD